MVYPLPLQRCSVLRQGTFPKVRPTFVLTSTSSYLKPPQSGCLSKLWNVFWAWYRTTASPPGKQHRAGRWFEQGTKRLNNMLTLFGQGGGFANLVQLSEARSENGCAKSHVLIWNRPGSRESGGRYSRKAFLGVPAGGPAQARGDMWSSIFSRKLVNWKKYRIYSEVLKLVFSRETKNPSRKFRTLR